jgi:uncharacterized membrane protein
VKLEAYLQEWANLVLRWLHVIAGITWIGTSFFFMWLDNSLRPAPEKDGHAGQVGRLWLIHSGGFYEASKFRMLPESMLDNLHWFKWEAGFTWLSGMALLVVIYYMGGDYFLIDRQVADLGHWAATGIGLGFLAGSWVIYDRLCNTQLGENNTVLAMLIITLVLIAAFILTQIFSARGAFIHVGAMLGTVMVANVFMVIIPAQKALVATVTRGLAPDTGLATKAKLRSTHNNYATLPLLFIMISNHYPVVYMHEYNWLMLTAIIAITASARHYFNLKHKDIHKPVILVAAGIAILLLALISAP